jgi:hypothetical protein
MRTIEDQFYLGESSSNTISYGIIRFKYYKNFEKKCNHFLKISIRGKT